MKEINRTTTREKKKEKGNQQKKILYWNHSPSVQENVAYLKRRYSSEKKKNTSGMYIQLSYTSFDVTSHHLGREHAVKPVPAQNVCLTCRPKGLSPTWQPSVQISFLIDLTKSFISNSHSDLYPNEKVLRGDFMPHPRSLRYYTREHKPLD